MNLVEFINNNDVEYTKNIVGEDTIRLIEKDLNIHFGDELLQYILKFGYLAFKHIEFYGINSNQMMDSDMVKQTCYLHKYFPNTEGYIAFGNYGDGEYVLVASDDIVCEFDSELGNVSITGKKLFEYILEVFLKLQ